MVIAHVVVVRTVDSGEELSMPLLASYVVCGTWHWYILGPFCGDGSSEGIVTGLYSLIEIVYNNIGLYSFRWGYLKEHYHWRVVTGEAFFSVLNG